MRRKAYCIEYVRHKRSVEGIGDFHLPDSLPFTLIIPSQKSGQVVSEYNRNGIGKTVPMQMVCKWIGKTELVAAKHDLQMTDDKFQSAAGKAMQNPLQQNQESHCIERKQ